MKRIRISAALMALFCCLPLLLTSCKNDKKKQFLPNVSGKAGEVLVVIDREYWEGNLGVAIRSTLADDTPYLAQREPLFNLSHVPSGAFNNMFRMHRNMLIVSINPQNVKTGMVYKNNVWAQPQAVAQLNAHDEEEALTLFQESGRTIAEYFEQSERDRIIANAKLYEENRLQAPVKELTGGVLHFPSGYKLRKRTEDFLWIADEKQYTNQTVLVYKYPVSGPDVFTLENIIAARNTVMQANVPGMFDGSYMTTSCATTASISWKPAASGKSKETTWADPSSPIPSTALTVRASSCWKPSSMPPATTSASTCARPKPSSIPSNG